MCKEDQVKNDEFPVRDTSSLLAEIQVVIATKNNSTSEYLVLGVGLLDPGFEVEATFHVCILGHA